MKTKIRSLRIPRKHRPTTVPRTLYLSPVLSENMRTQTEEGVTPPPTLNSHITSLILESKTLICQIARVRTSTEDGGTSVDKDLSPVARYSPSVLSPSSLCPPSSSSRPTCPETGELFRPYKEGRQGHYERIQTKRVLSLGVPSGEVVIPLKPKPIPNSSLLHLLTEGNDGGWC